MDNKYILFHNYLSKPGIFFSRIIATISIIFFLTSLLITNIYNLQIVKFKEYQTKANANRIKLIPIAPNRGIIFDRNNKALALNRIVYQLEIIPEKLKNLEKTINDLRLIIELKDEEISKFKKEKKRSFLSPSLPIKKELTEVEQAKFSVNQHRFAGIKIKGYHRRHYPYGTTFTHVIGYISKINNEDLDRLNREGILENYAATYNIGKLGIERYYENILHGTVGYEEVEVNSKGKIVRRLHEKYPQAGKNIILTLDLNLQKYVEELLSDNCSAAVVTNPNDGSILSLVSSPSYDPNLFVNGISKKEYNKLLKNKNFPLINRTIQGAYPPASVVKPYISISALNLKTINKNFLLFDQGWWKLPGSERRYRDWKKLGHGFVNITRAIEESADTFFYRVAYDMGIDKLSEWMKKFGFGQYTGIDLLEELSGNLPTKRWKINRFKKPWYQGDTISVGIGQGYWTATPLQISKALMTLINNGMTLIPHLLHVIQTKNCQIPYVNSKFFQVGDPHSEYWDIVKDGMFGVANRINGTAKRSFSGTKYKAAAKTGTAQLYSIKENETYNVKKIAKKLRDHKLMTAFAPFEKPTVAVVIILENGDPLAGVFARKILDYVLLKK